MPAVSATLSARSPHVGKEEVGSFDADYPKQRLSLVHAKGEWMLSKKWSTSLKKS